MFTTNRFASLPVDNYNTVDEESSAISISTSFDESPRLCVRRTAKLLRELNPTPLLISTSSTSFLRSSPVVDEYAREKNAYVIRRLLTLHRDRRRRGFAADAALARLSHASLEKLLPQVDQSPRNQVEDSILLDLEDDDGFPRDVTSCNAGPIKYDVFCSPYHGSSSRMAASSSVSCPCMSWQRSTARTHFSSKASHRTCCVCCRPLPSSTTSPCEAEQRT